MTAAILAAHPDIAGLCRFRFGVRRRHRHGAARSGQEPGDIKVTAMEQTPDFFKTAKEAGSTASSCRTASCSSITR